LIYSTHSREISIAKPAHNGEDLSRNLKQPSGIIAIMLTISKEVNTVGSSDFRLVTDSESAYILGLWCADGYYRSSSIGITNVDLRLIERFRNFLLGYFPAERLKRRIYYPVGQKPIGVKGPMYPMRIARQVAYQFYVNSRALVRQFHSAEQQVSRLPKHWIMPYFAGRFDGDGSVAANHRNDLRIVYSNYMEARIDLGLLEKYTTLKATIYHYAAAKTYVLYVSRMSAISFIASIKPFSVKLS